MSNSTIELEIIEKLRSKNPELLSKLIFNHLYTILNDVSDANVFFEKEKKLAHKMLVRQPSSKLLWFIIKFFKLISIRSNFQNLSKLILILIFFYISIIITNYAY